MAKVKRGENAKCGLMLKWWATVPAKERAFIIQKQKEFPYMRPCPQVKGGWVRITAECDYCEDAVFTDK